MNIMQTIREETREHLHCIAIIDGDRQITYGDLLEQVGQLSQTLAGRGITAGQRIGLHSGDGIDYVIAALALLQTGAAVVPIADNITAIEVYETIDRIDLQGVLIHAKVKRTEQEHSAEKISEVFSFQSRQARGEADENCRAMGAAFIRFSSGTTGASKGVVLSHRSIIDRTDAANRGLGITQDDVILWVLSMSYHFVVSILLFLRRGATIVVGNQFFPFSLLSAATKHAITFIYASPVHYHLLGQSDAVKPEALKKVRLAISTAMKMPPNVSQRFAEKFGFAPAEAYGIIEIGLPFINTQPRATPLASVGPALPDYQLRIANPDADGIGEVLIKGKGMFDAYFSPWRTLAEVTDGGWFDTGDLGKLDEEARLYLLGRSKTVLVCAGMKVFPEEVEQVINMMPGVKESLVSGKDHPQFGQMPVARVVVSSTIDTNELRSYCCQKLSSYKVPVEFSIVESLPNTASGKLARK